jgi:hypothetical protein
LTSESEGAGNAARFRVVVFFVVVVGSESGFEEGAGEVERFFVPFFIVALGIEGVVEEETEVVEEGTGEFARFLVTVVVFFVVVLEAEGVSEVEEGVELEEEDEVAFCLVIDFLAVGTGAAVVGVATGVDFAFDAFGVSLGVLSKVGTMIFLPSEDGDAEGRVGERKVAEEEEAEGDEEIGRGRSPPDFEGDGSVV